MSRARNLADLLDANGDVVSGALDNASGYDKATSSTGYLALPAGTTAQRPGSAATGYTRMNTTTGSIEFYSGTNWIATNLIPSINSITGDIYAGTVSTLTLSLTNATDTIDVKYYEGGTLLATDSGVTVTSGSATSTVPSAVYGQTVGDTISISIFNIDGTPSSNAISKTVTALPGTQSNPASSLSALLSARGWTDGSATEGVYWFDYTGSSPFPTAIHNLSSDRGTETWLMIQKNFVPHALKPGDAYNAGVGYGLVDSGGNVIVTTTYDNNTSQTPGTVHARVSVADCMSSGDFSHLLIKDRTGAFLRYTAGSTSTLYNRIVAGQAYNNTFEDDVYYSADWQNSGGARYIYFNTRMTAVDVDTHKMGVTYTNSISHDLYNTESEHYGTSWFRDGDGDYTGLSKDSALNGIYGQITFWVR